MQIDMGVMVLNVNHQSHDFLWKALKEIKKRGATKGVARRSRRLGASMRIRNVATVAVAILLLPAFSFPQQRGETPAVAPQAGQRGARGGRGARGQAQRPPSAPTPRYPDGHP